MEYKNVLIVDDDSGITETLEDILVSYGIEVFVANSGFQAIELAKERKFDIILMDIKMPEMNGVESLKRIKVIQPRTIIIMMTAYTMNDLITESLKEGAYDILNKPFNIKNLLNTLEKASKEISILIIDDDKTTRNVLEDILDAHGFKIKLAGDGKTAIKLTKIQKYDIYLVDLKMPELNGLETYFKIKNIDQHAKTIMMTGFREEMSQLIDEGLKQSVYTCIYKPYDLKYLIQLINEINRKEG